MPLTNTQREEIREKFYKECGQYCNDAFEEVADWWFPILDEQLDKKVEELQITPENLGKVTKIVNHATRETLVKHPEYSIKEIEAVSVFKRAYGNVLNSLQTNIKE